MQLISRYLKFVFFGVLLVICSTTPTHARIELSPDEKAFMQEHESIRVANELDWPPFDFAENGTATGYSIDLLKLVANKTRLRFTYVNGYSWDTLLKMGKNKELDVFPAVWWTKEREKFFNFTAAYIDTPYILVVHQDQHRIKDIESLSGGTLTGIQGFASTELAKKYYPEIKVIEVASAVEGLRKVLYGKADAYLGSMAETNFAIKNHLVPNLKIAGETTLGGRVKSPLLYIGVRKDWPVLTRIIQRGMDAITQEEKQRLQTKWLKFEESAQSLVFDEAEQLYLQKHPVLKVAFATDWPPVEYLNKKGVMTGIAADYLQQIKQLLGVEIEPVALANRNDRVAAIQNKEVHFLSAVSPRLRQSQWMAFTDPYLSYPIVIVTREDVPYIGNLDFLKRKPIAVVEGYAPHDILSARHPALKILTYPGVKEGLLAVSNKQAFAFVGSLATVSHVTGREFLTGLKVSGETEYSVDIAMATRKQDAVLKGLLQKALSAISVEDRNAIYSKWSQVTFEHRVDYSRLWKIGAAVLFLFALILYWNRRLRVMANELKSAKDAAESANKAKSTFLANMSHELRTPLNAILGFSQIMGNDHSLNPDQKDNLRIINSSGKHLLGLLNDLLDMAKIEAGRLVLRETRFDLHYMLTGIRDMLKPLASDKGLYLNLNIAPSTPRYIQADKDRVRQVLVNLIVNAIKYTDKGGVHVSAQGERSDKDQAKYSLAFTVKDTGQGIDPEYTETVFSPFVQLEATGKHIEGTGLGLAICRTLAQRMGGQIRLESERNKGSAFFFTIEVRFFSASEQKGHPYHDSTCPDVAGLAPGQPEFRILVIDDNEINRKLLMVLLKDTGFIVKGVDSADKVLNVIKTFEPRLLLMDIRMPNIDGLQATRQIRDHGFNSLKIIGVSASAFEEDKAACLAAGCDDFISKPVRKSEILKMLMFHLGTKYIYREDIQNNASKTVLSKPDRPSASEISKLLFRLPQDLVASFKDAVFSFDYEETMIMIKKIRTHNKSLADLLAAQALEYQFGALQNLFSHQEKT